MSFLKEQMENNVAVKKRRPGRPKGSKNRATYSTQPNKRVGRKAAPKQFLETSNPRAIVSALKAESRVLSERLVTLTKLLALYE